MQRKIDANAWCRVAITTVSLLLVAGWSHAQQMLFPTDHWVTSTPESVLVDPQALNNAISYVESVAGSPGSEEMVVIRNGRLIWEGSASGRAHHTWSVTKSFATTMLGLGIDDGLVTLDTLVSEFVPAVGDLYPEMTLRHAATHTSGYLAEGENYPFLPPDPDNPFIPATPLFTPPGSMYAYNNTPLTQMMNVLTRAAGEPMQDLFERRIGDPIGMDTQNWDWGHYTTDDGLTVDGGGGYAGKGVAISASDLGRFGHLFLNQGNWGGQQLISAEWIDQATTVQVPSNVPRHPLSIGGPGFYGYGWWVDDDVFAALGYENNSLLVWPNADLIVARLGTDAVNVSWLDAVANRFSQAMRTIAVWDGEGDGTWEEFDMQTGNTRWRGRNDAQLVIYPDNHPGNVSISSNTVTALEDHRVEVLLINGDARLRIEGATISADRSSISSNATMEIAGSLILGRTLLIHDQGKLHLTLDSTRSTPYVVFADAANPALGGTLELSLCADVEPTDLVGHTFDLFEWDDDPRRFGEFAEIVVPPGTQWDFSQLYPSGEVTLVAVPEPLTAIRLIFLLAMAFAMRGSREQMRTPFRLCSISTLGVLVAVACCVMSEKASAGLQFTELVVFGDSGSDTGNWGFRFSNGPVWVEELATQFDLRWPRPSERGGMNYAWGGARTGFGIDWIPSLGVNIPTVGWQIEEFLSRHSPTDSQLFVIRAGANDFALHDISDASIPVANIVTHISDLAAAGAANFVFSNMEPFGYFPASRGTSQEEPANRFAEDYNTLITQEIDRLKQSLDISVFYHDSHRLVTDVFAQPSRFGLTNVTSPANQPGVRDRENYLFWDEGHFTTTMHRIWGEMAAEIVAADFANPILAQSPEMIYSVVDVSDTAGFDGLGDEVVDLRVASRGFVGEVSNDRLSRLISKFELPDPNRFGGTLERAVLRFFVDGIAGTPEDGVSVMHSVDSNDLAKLPSDYEDPSYIDVGAPLVMPTDPIRAFYEVDVTDVVAADYESDSDSPVSSFRLQVNAEHQSSGPLNFYAFNMLVRSEDRPSLVLTFVPEPATSVLAVMAVLAILRWR